MENLSKKSNKGIMAKNVYGSYLNIVFSRLCAVLLIVFIIFGCSGIVALADTYKYYDLLTKNQKKIYEKFDKKWMSSKKKNAKKVEVKGKYEDCLRAIDALYNDKPYLLASNHEPWYLTYKKTVEITMKGLNSINDREYLRDYPKTLNLAGENDIETVTNIFEWLALNNKYDDVGNVPGKEKDVFHSIKGIFKHGEAVCEGYARAFKYLCDLHDIPCVLVVGDGYHSRTEFEYHMWNYVQIDGVWYGVDPTWGGQLLYNRRELYRL